MVGLLLLIVEQQFTEVDRIHLECHPGEPKERNNNMYVKNIESAGDEGEGRDHAEKEEELLKVQRR